MTAARARNHGLLVRFDSYVPLGRIDLGKPAANGVDVRLTVHYFCSNVSGLP